MYEFNKVNKLKSRCDDTSPHGSLNEPIIHVLPVTVTYYNYFEANPRGLSVNADDPAAGQRHFTAGQTLKSVLMGQR